MLKRRQSRFPSGKLGPSLPGCLAGNLEIKVSQSAAIGVDDSVFPWLGVKSRRAHAVDSDSSVAIASEILANMPATGPPDKERRSATTEPERKDVTDAL